MSLDRYIFFRLDKIGEVMYRLLLLDDEEIVTRGIQKVFDLEKSGFQVVGVFQNPQKALESLPGLQPDLMITDIKMPQMSGLDFAAEAKQLLPESEIVILSGYGDFGFAQSAVKIGVSDYLLKPIKKDDFQQMLDTMHAKLEEKKTQKQQADNMALLLQNSYTELKNRFFLSLAEDNVFDEKLYQTLQKHHTMDVFDTDFLLVKVDFDQAYLHGDYMSEIGKLIQDSEGKFADFGFVEAFLSDESLYFYVYNMKASDEEMIRQETRLLVEEKRQKGIQLVCGISHMYHGIRELFRARNDCIRRIFMQRANIDEHSAANPIQTDEINVHMPYEEIETLFHMITTGEMEGLPYILRKIYELPEDNIPILLLDYSCSVTFLILLRVYQLQFKFGLDQQIVSHRELDLRVLKREYPSMEIQRNLVEKKLLTVAEQIAVQEMAAPSKMIRAALDYINEHFHENISLMDVAENINISKNYLCDIFKKELGVTFINYVTNLRIEKAKEYLTGTDMKMYEVSNAVGYNDYAYFSQIFKKHTGKTLSSYRKKK